MSREPRQETDETAGLKSTLDGVDDADVDQPPIEVKRAPRLRSGKHEELDSTD